MKGARYCEVMTTIADNDEALNGDDLARTLAGIPTLPTRGVFELEESCLHAVIHPGKK